MGAGVWCVFMVKLSKTTYLHIVRDGRGGVVCVYGEIISSLNTLKTDNACLHSES